MSLDLRPLTLGELLDRSFSLYRRHFWLFVGIMALALALGLAFGLLVALFNPQPGSPGSVAPDANPAEILGAVLWFGAAMIGMLVVYFITYAVALGATTVAVSQLYMGRPTRFARRTCRCAAAWGGWRCCCCWFPSGCSASCSWRS